MRKVEPFDKRLKERAKQEPFPLPETYAGKVRDTCAALKETNMKENKQKRSYRWLVGVAAALAVFVAIPNVSPAAAAASILATNTFAPRRFVTPDSVHASVRIIIGAIMDLNPSGIHSVNSRKESTSRII